MTRVAAPPFSRPVLVSSLPAEGLQVTVEASPEECAALARQFGLPAVHSLSGRYLLRGTEARLAVTGRAKASVAQTCVVTLDPFDAEVDEPVEVVCSAEGAKAVSGDSDRDPPDPIVDDRVDLGALTAEFLALGLDPHPRKPGASFDDGEREDESRSPFADLAGWRGRTDEP